ncbi:MAG: 50S ribosomal protein L10 [Candidatus Pacebacteria bacterium]|nr:50S ribosomal protein L10 [Candidatus Paceibacterota bacterium]
MPKTREEKQKIVENLKENIQKGKAIFFVGIKGLKAKEIFNLRENLKKEGAFLYVVKKTLLDIAFKENNINFPKDEFKEDVAVIFSLKDEILPLKVAYQFAKTNENLKILGGFFEKEFVGKDEVISLSTISSKEDLISRLVWTINAPISNFVNVLEANIKGLLNVLAKAKA